jgi:hypothetical protein
MRLTTKHYLLAALAIFLGCEALIAGFNLVIDPLGISPIQIQTELNTFKPLRNGNDRLVKRYDVDRLQPRTVFIGSSRIKQALDPSLLNGTIYGPAYNAGIDGEVDPSELEALLQHHLRADRNLRHVFIEVFATAALTLPAVRPLEPDRFLKRLNDWSTLLNSYGGLSYSWKTISYNLQLGAPPAGDIREVRENGFAPFPEPTHHFSVFNVPNFATYIEVVPSGKNLFRSVAPALARLIDLCKSYEIECSFILTPLHADVLYGAYFKNGWEEFETLKRTLASLALTWDFTRYNALIDERDGRVVYWPEAFHYSAALGALILQRLSGRNAADLPPNFGVMIDPHNVEDQLAAWRTERDAWILEHPDVVARYNAAAANKSKGLTLSEATDVMYRSFTP